MAIVYDEERRIFSIHTKESTYQMQADRLGYLLHLYYGPKTEMPMDGRLVYLDRGFSANPYDAVRSRKEGGRPEEAGRDRTYSLDALPQEFPFQGGGDFRSPLLKVTDERGITGCDLRYVSHRIYDGKYELPGLPHVRGEAADAGIVRAEADETDRTEADTDCIQTLEILLRSEDPRMEVVLLYGVLPHLDIITRSAVIRNAGPQAITVDKAQTACLDFIENDAFHRIIFHGRHNMERIPDRRSVGPGSFVIGSRRGFSSHQYNPFMILCHEGATENDGCCWAMQFVYSGGFKGEIEQDQYGQTRMQMGLMEDRFAWTLAPAADAPAAGASSAGTLFNGSPSELVLPEVILSFSCRGLNSLSGNYHRCIREHVCRRPKHDFAPILLNSWEACFFDFTGEKICRMAEEAGDLGMDMIVLDDGWFGERDDDLRALGDWVPNEQKLGGSLRELSERIHGMGLKFGLWVEPEMISEESDLYRAHPDWAMRIPGRAPVMGRDQLMLDLSRREVADGICERLCRVLDSARIDYMKWDANRQIIDLYSAETPSGMILHRYVLELYRILERLNRRYPDLLIEGCAGGGGRFDAGMLFYTPQIWCSDNTDPIDRLQIQYGTSFGYPVCTMGAHVSASPNGVTGRKTPLKTRAAVAMTGTFGYELDPEKLTDQDKEEIRGQIRRFRQHSELIRTGSFHRLADPGQNPWGAWMIVSADRRTAMVTIVRGEENGTDLSLESTVRVPLRGLQPDAVYRLEETGRTADGRTWNHEGLAVRLGPCEAFQGILRSE